MAQHKRRSKQEREVQRAAQANSFNEGFRMGYLMGKKQAEIDARNLPRREMKVIHLQERTSWV